MDLRRLFGIGPRDLDRDQQQGLAAASDRVPKQTPTPAVSAMASAPPKATRTAPLSTGAPPQTPRGPPSTQQATTVVDVIQIGVFALAARRRDDGQRGASGERRRGVPSPPAPGARAGFR
jgi:hypothetical protein